MEIIMIKGTGPLTWFLEMFPRVVFGAIATILSLLALVLAGNAVVQLFRAAWVGGDVAEVALVGISYVVVAVATFEIARHLTEEEVVRRREKRLASARRSLARLISTVAAAIFLEALVIVFHVGKENVPQLIYPTLLLIAGILIVLGLGVYQRLSTGIEDQVEERDIAEGGNQTSRLDRE